MDHTKIKPFTDAHNNYKYYKLQYANIYKMNEAVRMYENSQRQHFAHISDDVRKMLDVPETRCTFDKTNSMLCNADSIDKRLHRDYGIAVAGFNMVNEF